MQRRLDLAMTLVGNPSIIFLDEPTTGLDPRSRRELWGTIRQQVANGVTVFLTTQYLEEADALADRIAVLDAGRIVAEGTADDLKRSVPGGHLSLTFTSVADLGRAQALLPVATGDQATLTLTVPGDTSMPAIRTLIARFDEAALVPESLAIHRPDLNDVFLALTGSAPAATEVTR
jgi:ABC-2 type transport system ATP-binding protein